MIELEIQILSDRREGLLVELGRTVVANGFTLLRQRLAQDDRGAWLTMIVRGPPERQLALEEELATHSRVRSFECSLFEGGAAPPPASGPAVARAPIAAAPATFAAPASSVPPAGPDVRQVESMLPQIAKDYPRITPWLLTLQRTVAAESREASLLLVGRRTGAWVFKRDYAMGAKLGLADAIKRIGVPALRALATIEQHGEQLHIQNSPLCSPNGHSGCKFFSGYLEGLLGASIEPQNVFVRSLYCRSTGAVECILEISH
ncbi:hypothetical protein [Dyella tabacisoli]|uniref:4-vinyl reductase 4VR domain-containing protein n=1 Tax=Dyella tabacisoli TaxID=2282381 RepID=A0A369UJ84_9GAMM|nr:hypothetical protein [Dyella tabacisoli]RDD80804.1 hypothetical protein DVJ77_15210 [Dyella tabacisoli]